MDPNNITFFGETDARNKKIKFGIKAKDRLKHVYVIGKTGMGKSTLLENMAIQDIQSGNGMALIDPHGGTAEKLLEYIPENRIQDVLYFAPFDMEYPISFNVMEDIGVDKRHLVVNGLMSTFEKIWVDAWSARMAYILNNTLLALLEYPGATLLGVNRMLSDKEYRKKVVDNIKDTSVRAFWVEEFGKWTEKFIAEAIPAIQNKVGQFTSNPLVRNLLGQPQSSFNIRKMMDEKKILIVNLSKGRVGEGNANLIGSMLITKIYLAAMSRADSNERDLAKLPNFYLYVDEFQSFANKSFADILSEARKYKLNLTIAHQYIEQMEEEVRNAVFGNVGTMITFRVGAFDAETLEKEFAPTFMAADLVNLGFAQIYLKLMIDGVSSQPFSATTLGPISKPEISFKDEVIEASRKQFAKPRAEVEKNIVDWHGVGLSGDNKSNSAPQNVNHQHSRTNDRYQDSKNNTQNNNSSHNHSRSGDHERKSFDNTAREQTPVLKNNGNVNTNNNEQTKTAFQKIAEELKEKNNRPEQVVKVEPISLTVLHKEKDKKNPTKENMSSLKDALASVIATTKTDSTEKIKKEESKHILKDDSDVKISNVKATLVKEKESSQKSEVPEEVLRKLLSMEDGE
ncbi:MAG: DUF87 domain-containing protein [Nitrospira sp.]